MKITEEVLANGKWVSEDIFRFRSKKYKVIKCNHCGNNCLIFPHTKEEGCCTKDCANQSEKFKKKVSLIHSGKKVKEETRNKLSLYFLGKFYNDLSNMRFGRLTVLPNSIVSKISPKGNRYTSWKCLCDCGNTKEIRTTSLVYGSTRSCGCLLSEKSSERLFKNGYSKRPEISNYNSYAEKLISGGEEIRRYPDEPTTLQVKCKYCGKWFSPSYKQSSMRSNFINGSSIYESYFYCSDGCRSACPIYGKTEKTILISINGKPSLNREVQPELRKMVLERDGWQCLKCKSTEELHCHHIEGIEHNPIESADLDLCMTVCKPCHVKIHHEDGCTYYDLRKCEESIKNMEKRYDTILELH